jgi:hypothetical protein
MDGIIWVSTIYWCRNIFLSQKQYCKHHLYPPSKEAPNFHISI